jgi:PAS domain S-box-containing protein
LSSENSNTTQKEKTSNEGNYFAIFNELPYPVIIHKNGEIIEHNEAFKTKCGGIYNVFSLFIESDAPKIIEQFKNPVKGNIVIVSKDVKNGHRTKHTLESFKQKYNGDEVIVTVFGDYKLQEDLAKETIKARIASEANMLLEKEVEKHKKTQNELKRSQEISKSVFNSSIDVIISTNLKGRITESSPSSFYTFGYTREEFFDLDLLDLFAYKEEFEESQKQLNEAGFFIGEVHNRKKDGSIFLSFVSCSAIKNQNNETIGFMGISRDITDLKKAEQQLITSEKRYRDLFMNLGDAIVVVDQNNQMLELNNTAKVLFEIDNGDTYNLYDFVHPEDYNFVKEQSTLFRKKGVIVNVEFRVVTITGKIKEINLSSTAIYEEDVFIGSRDVIRDITEQKRIERLIQEQNSKLESIFENKSDILIWTLDENLNLTSFNSKFGSFLKSSFEIDCKIGDNFYDILSPIVSPLPFKNLKQHFQKANKGTPQQFEVLLKNYKNGKTVWLESFLSPIRNKKFKVYELACIALDVTDKKTNEIQLTKSLKEKEVLLKEVHHRVKNNLQVISSILNLQSSYVKDENTLNILRESQNRVKSMSFIHESLYRSSDFSEVNFSEYINNLTSNIMHSFNSVENNIVLNLELNNVKLNLDQAIPCGLIVNELITNAMKYAFVGIDEPQLVIKLELVNDTINIFIEDNGIGLPKDFDITESDSLGLQLVTTLTEQLDGSLSIKVENGTKYLITFVKSFN